MSAVATCTQLEASIDMLRTGDKLVVTKLDRLARSVVLTPLVVPPLALTKFRVRQRGGWGGVCKGRQKFHSFLGLTQVHLKYIQSTLMCI